MSGSPRALPSPTPSVIPSLIFVELTAFDKNALPPAGHAASLHCLARFLGIGRSTHVRFFSGKVPYDVKPDGQSASSPCLFQITSSFIAQLEYSLATELMNSCWLPTPPARSPAACSPHTRTQYLTTHGERVARWCVPLANLAQRGGRHDLSVGDDVVGGSDGVLAAEHQPVLRRLCPLAVEQEVEVHRVPRLPAPVGRALVSVQPEAVRPCQNPPLRARPARVPRHRAERELRWNDLVWPCEARAGVAEDVVDGPIRAVPSPGG
eukprot:3933301-Rhodomonas_salina.2